MGKVIEFIGNNYVWFLTVTIMLLFALIGYIYDTRKEKNDVFKKEEDEMDEASIKDLIVPEGKKLNESINTTKNINPETKNVELVDDTILNNTEDTKTNENSETNNMSP